MQLSIMPPSGGQETMCYQKPGQAICFGQQRWTEGYKDAKLGKTVGLPVSSVE